MKNANNSDQRILSEAEERSQILLLLNEEISQIKSEESRPGWTVWALFGGLATCTWLLLNQIENQIPKWDVIKIMLIIITLSGYSLKALYGFLTMEKNTSDDRLISVSQIFSNSKMILIINLLWFLFIGYLVININILVANWQLFCTYFGIVFNIFFIFVGLILSTFNFVMPRNQDRFSKNKIFIVFFLIFLMTGLVAAFMWIKYLLNLNLLLVFEFKITLLISTIALLISISFSLKSPAQSLDNLIELRRDLILGVLPTMQIKNQIDLILRGLSIQDYYSKDLSDMLASLQLLEKEIFLATQKISLYKDNDSFKIQNEEKILTQDSLRESIMKHLISAAKIKFSQIDITKKKLTKKRTNIKALNKKFTDREIISEVIEETLKNIDSYNLTVKNWYELLNKTIGKASAQNMIIELCHNVPKLKFNIETGIPEE